MLQRRGRWEPLWLTLEAAEDVRIGPEKEVWVEAPAMPPTVAISHIQLGVGLSPPTHLI